MWQITATLKTPDHDLYKYYNMMTMGNVGGFCMGHYKENNVSYSFT